MRHVFVLLAAQPVCVEPIGSVSDAVSPRRLRLADLVEHALVIVRDTANRCMTRFVQGGRYAFVMIAITLAACGDLDGPVEDGTYIGQISSNGCISGSLLTIEVLNGKASFPSASVFCSANESTGGGLHYDCTRGGGESHYVCIMQSSINDVHDIVDATLSGPGKLEGTIEHSSTTYSPPNCMAASHCADSGSFELLLQR